MLTEAGAFERYYREVWSVDPFPWQRELVEQVQEEGRWPELIDLPTGTGKTSTLDVALFLLARDASRPPVKRVMPRRIVMVVDRRVVVDQAHDRARRLLGQLRGATAGSTAAAVADALRRLWDGGPGQDPFAVSVLRGGMVRDESWARRPDLPAVIASTVDQVGSRLLFRGYGLSTRMAPLHAGLLATDTLLLLDEVHLSRPFAETLRELQRHRSDSRLPTRWSVVELSATPGDRTHHRFPDRPLDPASHPVIGRRLRASKPVEMRVSKGRDRALLARDCATAALELLEPSHIRALAVVVNRVQTALEVARLLAARDAAPEIVVLTGRMRPIDRDEVVGRLAHRLRTGRDRTGSEPRLVVVATQCVEAGADFDFDGLVTECASLPALRQRFGRVDRDGRLSESGLPARGLILALGGELTDADDAVYGPALAKTWAELERQPALDFGIAALDSLNLGPDERLAGPPAVAPYLLPAHLDAWVQTQPKPKPDPDPALWLHGLDRPGVPDVDIVWRADLTQELLDTAAHSSDRTEDLLGLVAACPPVSGEALSVPINAVRAWLAQSGTAVPVADVEGAEVPKNGDADGQRPVARWRAGEVQIVTGSTAITPGDLLVVPSAYGGLDPSRNWNPASLEPVTDLALTAHAYQRQRVVLRLVGVHYPDEPGLPQPSQVPEDESDAEAVLGWLTARVTDPYAQHCVKHPRSVRVGRVTGPKFIEDRGSSPPSPALQQQYFVVTCVEPYAERKEVMVGAAYNPEDDNSTFIAREVELEDHLRGVEYWARRMAQACGLDEDLVDDLALAGRLHDVGKADPRFQVILHNGDEIDAASGRLLAKSGLTENDLRRQRRLRQQSGYPEGARHELMSLALIQDRPEIAHRANDWDLVCYLVSSHHGWCRPFPPAVLDPDPRMVEVTVDGLLLSGSSDHGLSRLDAGVPDRFWTLVRRYGPYGLAWLEAILQLADHRCSAEEQSSGSREIAGALP